MNSINGAEPTNAEILEAINEYASKIETDISSLKSDVGSLKDDVGILKTKVTSMEALMVTKDYLDDKLADLRGDILTVIRKEDRRLTVLVDILQEKKILTNDEVKKLEMMQPLVTIPGIA